MQSNIILYSFPGSLGDAASKKQQRVWTLRDGRLVAVPVTVGSTNGAMTEILAGEIQPGMPVVVDTVSTAE